MGLEAHGTRDLEPHSLPVLDHLIFNQTLPVPPIHLDLPSILPYPAFYRDQIFSPLHQTFPMHQAYYISVKSAPKRAIQPVNAGTGSMPTMAHLLHLKLS
jgi:hypothetical protein